MNTEHYLVHETLLRSYVFDCIGATRVDEALAYLEVWNIPNKRMNPLHFYVTFLTTKFEV